MTTHQRGSGLRFMFRLLVLPMIALGAAGCASTTASMPENGGLTEQSQEAPPTEPVQEIPQPTAAKEYVMAYGDVLDIRFFYNPELNMQAPIRPDGKISLELVGDIQAAGLSPAALTDQLRDLYEGKLRNPEVTVILSTFSDRKIYVGGEVNNPRAIELGRDQTVFQAIMEAGGFKATAHLANVVVLRDQGTSEPLFFTLDYKDTVKYGAVDPEAAPDLSLQPNDIIFVPKTRVARWGQLVDQYFTQLVPISLNMGLTYFAGSFN